MIPRGALLLALALAAACGAPASEAPPPLVAPPGATDQAGRLRSARAEVLDAVAAAHGELAEVLAAQESVERVVRSVGASLDGMRAWLESEALAVPEERFAELREGGAELLASSAALTARVAALAEELDAFEARALDELDGLESAPRAPGGEQRAGERLDDLLARVDALAERVAPVVVESEALTAASLRLSESAEAQRDDVRRRLSVDEQVPMKTILRDPATDVEVTLAPGTVAAPATPEEDAAAASAAAAWNREQVAEIVTSHGSLVVEFFPEDAPRHVQNFLDLARRDFYDGLVFWRVIPAFVAQAGCPEGTGHGGPGYTIDAEFNDRPHRRGTLSMARFAHPDSAGSQFFLCLEELPQLDGKYTVFGRLVAGKGVLKEIEELGTIEGRPTETITIHDVVLRERAPDERVEPADDADG